MDINAYRRKIEQSVAKAEKAAVTSTSRTRGKDPQGIVASRRTPAKTRVEALGRATREEGPDAVPETALARLADPKESAAVRLAAIKLLQQKQFFSTSAAEWRPAFVDALRIAVRDPRVRPAALEVLSLFKDRATQEQLLEGIRTPAKALVEYRRPCRRCRRREEGDGHPATAQEQDRVRTGRAHPGRRPVICWKAPGGRGQRRVCD
jgi:hypothetical protein